MAQPQKKRKKQPKSKELWLGIGAVAASIAVLLLICFSFTFGRQTQTETTPQTTSAAALTPLQANIYGPEDFQYDGQYLTCLAGESVLGIDVSSHQLAIDWEQVRDAGVSFVMVRLGYRGYESGSMKADERALENLAGAKAAGLQVGAYFYSQAVSVAEAEEEAAFALEILDGMALDMPLVYDWEYVNQTARTANVESRMLTDCTIAFCEAVKEAGYKPMVYFNTHLAETGFLLEELTDYDFWLALYDNRMDFPYRVQMWQYTSTGTVPGIETDVDINLHLP